MQGKTVHELGKRLARLVKASAGGWIPRKPYEPAQKPGWIPPKPYEPAANPQMALPNQPAKPGAVTPQQALLQQQQQQQQQQMAQAQLAKGGSARARGVKLADTMRKRAFEKYVGKTYERLLEKAAAELGVDVANGPLTKEAVAPLAIAAALMAYPALRGVWGIGQNAGWWGSKPADEENPGLKSLKQQQAMHQYAIAHNIPQASPFYSQYGGRGGYGYQQPQYRPTPYGNRYGGGRSRGLYGADAQRYAARLGIDPQQYQAQERFLQDMMSGSAMRARQARAAREYGASPMW